MRRTFQYHPSELRKRRLRCRPIVQHLLTLEREVVSECNVCAAKTTIILSSQDRYGLPVRTAMCNRCGLVYLVDRFTAAAYRDFYHEGYYRRLVSAFKMQPLSSRPDPHLVKSQARYAQCIADVFGDYLKALPPNAQVLDVGGGVGLVAQEFTKRFGFSGTVIDPSTEVHAAEKLGLRAIVGSMETLDIQEKFDLVLVCRTIEHFVDLRTSLQRIRDVLKPGGLCFCDISEFMEICRREGPPEATTKVDHCFWLTQETAASIFRACGLEVIGRHVTWAPDQMGFLLAPATADLSQPDGRDIQQQLRVLREIDSDWRRSGDTATGPTDWLRQRAYSVRRRLRV